MAVELDPDNNGAIDIALGGTNAKTVAEARANLGLSASVADYTAARALTGLSAGQIVSIAYGATIGDGGGGDFVYRTGDFTSQVAADTLSGVYLTLNIDPTGSSQILERIRPSGFFDSAWFGVTTSNTDNGAGISAAGSLASFMGGGVVELGAGSYQATQIIVYRNTFLRGKGMGATELFQVSATNSDFIVSESFSDLTGTGLTVADDSRVPSFFGLIDVRINGNRAGNSSGQGIAFYGPAITLRNVLVHSCAGNGVYTEYSDEFGSTDWTGQEEGQIDYLISRENKGIGWLNRGPHNTTIGVYLAGYNLSWGYYSETSGVYDGNVTEIARIHTYANARESDWPELTGLTAEQDRGSYIGAVSSINHLVVDGDFSELAAANIQIDRIKAINTTQTHDGVTISGSFVNIGMIHSTAASQSISTGGEKYQLVITGSHVTVGEAKLLGSTPGYHNGLSIQGSASFVTAGVYARDLGTGVSLTSTEGTNVVHGRTVNCEIGFNYTRPTGTHTGFNRVDLAIYLQGITTKGVYVAGDSPRPTSTGNRDYFKISAHGASTSVESGTAEAGAASKLTDSAQNFLTTVRVGMVVTNTTTSAEARVTAVDSDTVVSLSSDILSSGGEGYTIKMGNLFSETEVVSDNLPLEVTTTQVATIPHSLLYTPSVERCSLTLVPGSTDFSVAEFNYIKVFGVDAANVYIRYRLSTIDTGKTAKIALKAIV